MQQINRCYGLGIAAIAVMGSVSLGMPSRSIAQSCYMVTASGKKVPLGPLCGEAPVTPSGQPSSTAKNGIYRIPIKRRLASTPVVDVTFNGKTFEMIFDTGASSTLITQRMSDVLRLKPIGARNVIIADGSKLRFPVTSINTVSAGGVTARKLIVTIAKNSEIGLLGHDFFGRYDVKIKRNIIEFHPPSE